MISAWMAPERATAHVTSPTGEILLIRPLDPEFWGEDGPIEIGKYFAKHDAYLSDRMANEQIVYHYTNLAGLHGIVRDGAIWASDARSLNDRVEIKYAMAQIRNLIANEKGNEIGDQPLDAVFRPSRVGQFVACFSRSRDQLSQWRAYGSKVAVAIGFDREHLARAIASRKGQAFECRYLAPNQFSEVRDELEPIVSALTAPGAFNDDGKLVDVELQNNLTREAVRIATSIKHPSFAEERELRLAVTTDQFTEQLEFRSNHQALVPFISIDIDGRRIGSTEKPKYANHLGIMEVVVWPSNVDNQILDAVEMLFGEAGSVLVSRSDSPYRT